jgi:4-amino-4-deoxy-L-arabinose transferase-like glycosyltransferase
LTLTETKPVELARADRATLVLILLLLGRLIFGLAYSALIPLGEAPDEADHYAYAAYIAREGRLPVGPEMTQGKHPPLYHLLAAKLIRLMDAAPVTGFLRANPDVGVTPDALAPNFFIHTRLEDFPWPNGAKAMHLGRLVSVFAGVLLTAATYALGRRIWPGWYAGPLAAAAFVAFLPESLFIGGAMSNDMLAAMWITLAMWLALRDGWPSTLLTGLCMGLAMMTKASTAALWPVICLAILVRVWRPPARNEGLASRLLRSATPAALAGVVALLVAGPWLARNTRLYGDPLGWPLVLATIDQRTAPLAAADYGWLARGWFVSLWGKFGGAGHIALPAVFYWIWGALLLATIAGWLAVLSQRRRTPASRIAPEGWVMMVGAPIAAVAAILSYSRTALGTDQGRLLFPALAVISLWVAGGLSAWWPPRRMASLPLWVGGGMALIAVLALIYGIIRPYAPFPEPSREEVIAAAPVARTFGDDLELVAYRWSGSAPQELILYWRALRPVEADLRTAARLVDAEGNLLWEWKRSPGAGRMSTDRWPEGRVFEDVYRAPAEALAGAQKVEIGVRPFPEGPWLPVNGEDLLPLWQAP